MTKQPSFKKLPSGLITFKQDGKNYYLGYLLSFQNRVFDATQGQLDLKESDIEAHNNCLSEIEIDRFKQLKKDEKITLYFTKKQGKPTIHTFVGKEIRGNIRIVGSILTLTNLGRMFRGRIHKNDELITLKRIK